MAEGGPPVNLDMLAGEAELVEEEGLEDEEHPEDDVNSENFDQDHLQGDLGDDL